MTVQKKAYAKINLTLEILGTRRGDGFHDIASVMHKAFSLYDEVSVTLTDTAEIVLECDKDVCAPEENLAYRAAKGYLERYRQKTATVHGAHIRIAKRIPAGAGLAGGSTDAAAVLDALRELLGGLAADEIFVLALSLGSDVPFCLEEHVCALCTGRGEIMRELPPLSDLPLRFVFPQTPLSTKGIYGAYDARYGDDYTKDKSLRMADAIESGAPLSEIAMYLCNDFQPLCEERCPEIAEACELLRSGGYAAQMSGSGSAVFGIFIKD